MISSPTSVTVRTVARWTGIILLLLPFLGIPLSWKFNIIFIIAIVLFLASFFVKSQVPHTHERVDEEDEDTSYSGAESDVTEDEDEVYGRHIAGVTEDDNEWKEE
jgi:low affinity Fe/Cu permease